MCIDIALRLHVFVVSDTFFLIDLRYESPWHLEKNYIVPRVALTSSFEETREKEIEGQEFIYIHVFFFLLFGE